MSVRLIVEANNQTGRGCTHPCDRGGCLRTTISTVPCTGRVLIRGRIKLHDVMRAAGIEVHAFFEPLQLLVWGRVYAYL